MDAYNPEGTVKAAHMPWSARRAKKALRSFTTTIGVERQFRRSRNQG